MERYAAGDGQPARFLLLSALLLAIGTGGPRSQSWAAVCNNTTSPSTTAIFRVESLASVDELKEAVDCDDGGYVEAVWSGSNTIYNAPISIGSGTFLSISGEDQQAVVFGGGKTHLFHLHEGGSLSLAHLKLSNGDSEEGGAIYSYEASLTLDSCVFDGNSASSTATNDDEDGVDVSGTGGAVWAQGGEVTILGGAFSNNSVTGFGGGLFVNNTDLLIQNGTSFEDNKAVQGGALYGMGFLLSCSLNNVSFVSNIASEGGGAAAFFDTEAEIVISDCFFARNVALLSGGAVFAGADVDLAVDECTFRNNTALVNGGAIAASSVTIGGRTELSHNFASEDGGAVFGWDHNGEIAFEGVSCVENWAGDVGGCLYGEGNVTVAGGTDMGGNVAYRGGCIYAAPQSNMTVDGGAYTCKARNNGGFLFAGAASLVRVIGASVTGNVATRRAGAVYCSGDKDDLQGSQVTIEGGEFSNNEALEVGGAISAWGKTTLVTIAGGTFESNKAKFYGGFVFLEEEASLSCEGGTMSNNFAGDQGGAVYAREATWFNSSCDIIDNESPQGSAAYLTYVGGVTLQNSTMSGLSNSGGSVVFVAQSPVAARAATFESGDGVLEESVSRAIQLDVNSTFICQDCVFNGWVGDTVVYSANAANGSLVLDNCDFSGSSATTAVMSPYSDAEIRNALVGDETLVNVESVDQLQLVDNAVECSDQDACGETGECVDSALGVLCECLLRNGDVYCLDDGGTVSLKLQTPPDDVTYDPNLVTFELLVSASGDGTTYVIWDLMSEAEDLSLVVVPWSGILPPGGKATVTVTGTPTQEDVGGIMLSRFTLTSVGSGRDDVTVDGSTTGGMTELQVNSSFYLCPAYEYGFLDEDDNIKCEQCSTIEGADGVDCEEPGATLTSLPIREGYWRSSKESPVVLSCSHSEACVGATEVSSSDDYCADGYMGPYCAVCTEGYGKGAGSSCHSCENDLSRVLMVAGVLFSVAILAVVVVAGVFLIGGLDAVSGIHRSVFTATSVWPNANKKTSIGRSFSDSDTNGGDGAPALRLRKAITIVSASEESEPGAVGGQSDESPRAPLHLVKSSSSCDDGSASKGKHLSGEHGGMAACSTGHSETGVAADEKSTDLGGVVPSAMLGCSAVVAMEHGDDRAADAEEEAEDTDTSNSGRFGCYWIRGKIQKLASRLPFNKLKIQKLASRLPFNKLKILVVVWQILTVFPTITAVDYPPSYSRFLSWIDVVNLDLGNVLSASCLLPSVTLYERLLVTTLLPIALAGVLVLTHQLAIKTAGIGSRGVIAKRAAWSRHMAAGLLLTFLVFTSASTVVFKTFACDTEAIEGQSFLRADYRLSCKSNKHTLYMIYAGFMILVYPIGIPLIYFFILWTNRHSLNPRIHVEQTEPAGPERTNSSPSVTEVYGVGVQASIKRDTPGSDEGQHVAAVKRVESEQELEELVRKRKQNPMLVPSMFLWKDFGPNLYYYEVIECGRRILLTGVLIFIAPHTASQAAMACIFAFASLLGFELLRPHLDLTDAWLYRLGCVVIFLSNFLALLIKVDAAGEGKRAALGGLLVAVNVCLVLAVLVTSWFATQQQVDDSRDEENILATVKTMATTERLVAESRRQIRMEKQITPRWRQVPEAVGPARANPSGSDGLAYATFVGSKPPASSGGHGISGSSVGEEPFDSVRTAMGPVRGRGIDESILSRTKDFMPPLISGRPVIRGGSVADEMMLSFSEEDTSGKSGASDAARSASASLTSAGHDPSLGGGGVGRGSLQRRNAKRGRDDAPAS